MCAFIVNNGRIRRIQISVDYILSRFQFSSIKLILLVSLFITILNNQVFFSKASERLELFSFEGGVYLFTVYTIIFSLLVFVHFVVGQKYLLKALMVLLLLLSATLSYFNQELGVIFDGDMIRNIVETIKDNNKQEAFELLSLPLLKHIFLYGLLPAFFVLSVKITRRTFVKESLIRAGYGVGLFLLVAALILINFKYVTYFSRENRDLRFYITPLFAVDSLINYQRKEIGSQNIKVKILGDDAVQDKVKTKRVIGLMVVGETARGDHFSLNGYARETNPKLKEADVINFTQARSCGTSTAFSVPCMFSFLGRSDYSPDKAKRETNVLDVLETAGVKTFWIDNNSSCKGVCKRIGEVNLRREPDAQSPFYADGELFDEVLITKVDEFLSEHDKESDVLIVLHTLGSHGPKYYKRYPDEFSKFEPACKKATPQECTDQENVNAYDNTILYTDHVLSEMIRYLKEKQSESDTFMIYASDHGESLGEKGVYLHGLPYFLAPDAQTHIPLLAWFSDTFTTKNTELNKSAANKVSHDNLSHSLLGAFNVKSRVYRKEYDLF